MPNFPECEDCYLRSQVKELESKLKTAEIDRDRYRKLMTDLFNLEAEGGSIGETMIAIERVLNE